MEGYVPGFVVHESTTSLLRTCSPEAKLGDTAKSLMTNEDDTIVRTAGYDLATYLEMHPIEVDWSVGDWLRAQ